MTESTRDALMLQRAVDLATRNVKLGGGPFGAVIVTAEDQIFEGTNRVTANLDPTAHAEVSAIRAACTGLGRFELSGTVLYSSCEPCPMCLSSALWARVDAVVFAAGRHDAAAAGFDDAVFYEFFEDSTDRDSLLRVSQLALPSELAIAPFAAWEHEGARTTY